MNIQRWVYLTLIILLATLFVGYFYAFSVNFPIIDDTAFINYVYFFKQMDFSMATLPEFINRLFRVDNDHSLVIPRLVTLADYAVDGSINFKGILLLISGVTLVIFYQLYRLSGLSFNTIKFFLPAALLYFQPQYYSVSNWTLSGLNHVFVIFWLILALQLSEKQRWGWTMFIASLGVFTSGNGFLIFLVLAYVVFLKKEFKKLWLIAAVLLANLMLYFTFYVPGQENKLAAVFQNMGKVVQSFIVLVGSVNYGWLGTGVWAALALGMLIIGVFVFGTFQYFQNWNKREKRSPLLLGVVLFNLLTFALIALSRAAGDGEVVASRYQYYAVVGTVSAYLLVVDFLQSDYRKYFFLAMTAFALIFNVSSYYTYTKIVHFDHARYAADAENWVNNRTMLAIHPDFVKNVGFFLPDATDQKIWNPKSRLIKEGIDVTGKLLQAKPLVDKFAIFERRKEFSQTSKRDNVNYIFSVQGLPIRPALRSDWFVALKSKMNDDFYYLPISFESSGKKAFFSGDGYYQNLGYVQLNAESLVSGDYEIYFYLNDREDQLFRSNQTLIIKGLEITTQKSAF